MEQDKTITREDRIKSGEHRIILRGQKLRFRQNRKKLNREHKSLEELQKA